MEPLFTVAVVLFALAIFWQALGHGRAIERLYSQLNAGKPNTWVSDGGTTYNLAEASEIVEMDGELVKVQVVGTLGMTEEDCRRSLHASLGQQGLRIATTNPDPNAPLWESAEEKSLGSINVDLTAEYVEAAWSEFRRTRGSAYTVCSVDATGDVPPYTVYDANKLDRETFGKKLTEGFAKSDAVVFFRESDRKSTIRESERAVYEEHPAAEQLYIGHLANFNAYKKLVLASDSANQTLAGEVVSILPNDRAVIRYGHQMLLGVTPATRLTSNEGRMVYVANSTQIGGLTVCNDVPAGRLESFYTPEMDQAWVTIGFKNALAAE